MSWQPPIEDIISVPSVQFYSAPPSRKASRNDVNSDDAADQQQKPVFSDSLSPYFTPQQRKERSSISRSSDHVAADAKIDLGTGQTTKNDQLIKNGAGRKFTLPFNFKLCSQKHTRRP